MDHTAPTDHRILDLLAQRWSPRAFDPEREVAPGLLRRLFEAARWAPSSYNEQPWRFVVARRGEDGHAQLLGMLSSRNQQWAGEAPVLGCACTRLRFSKKDDQPNPHARHDVGLALMSLTVEATAHDLVVHQMAGFDAEGVRTAFDVPAPFEPVTAFTLGYLGDPHDLPASMRRKLPRQRRPLSETVFTGRFGEAAPWV